MLKRLGQQEAAKGQRKNKCNLSTQTISEIIPTLNYIYNYRNQRYEAKPKEKRKNPVIKGVQNRIQEPERKSKVISRAEPARIFANEGNL